MPPKSTCACPAPPGGVVRCEVHQFAYCRVKKGVHESGCFDPPPVKSLRGIAAQTVIDNWALAIIMKTRRGVRARITANEAHVLQSGFYRDPITLEEVSFILPQIQGGATGSGFGQIGGGGGGARPTVLFEVEEDIARDMDQGAGSGFQIKLPDEIAFYFDEDGQIHLPGEVGRRSDAPMPGTENEA